MIRHWSIKNFKSVGDAELPLAPLTLFAGANSSGKSTILQSILLVAQTLAARGSTQTVVLNGQFIKLGQFDDLRNDSNRHDRIEISWTLAPEIVQDRAMMRFRRGQNAIESISCGFVFGLSKQPDKSEQLNPILHNLNLSCAMRPGSDDGTTGRSYVRLARRSPQRVDQRSETKPIGVRVTFDYAIDLDSRSLDELRDDYADAYPVGCFLHAFLPASLVVRFDEGREMVRAIIGVLSGAPRSRYARHLDTTKTVIPQAILSELQKRIPAQELSPLPDLATGEPPTLAEFIERIRRSRVRSVLTSEAITDIQTYALSQVPQKHEILPVPLPGGALDDAVDLTRDFFSRQIRYLGPLREEPRALYPLHNTADPQEIGLHGEHTAAVLHRFRFTEVEYVPSAYFSESKLGQDVRKGVLRDAVFDWLRYLDVASHIDTADEGKFGYGLKVRMGDGRTSHDLTHVGVGVSQVLPIVVMCLLASRDTTIILEQPELHLNPKVQTRLGDFFLSMAMVKKQCLVETHSEYLINRLRLRAARAPGTSVSDLIKLYFVERTGGFSTYRDVIVNEFGNIVRWPEGFFDQSQAEIEQILLAASQKDID